MKVLKYASWLFFLVLTACESSQVKSKTSASGCLSRNIASICKNYLSQSNSRTTWGFQDILPIKQNPGQLERYRDVLQMDSVGAVYTKTRPFRASSFYLGSIVDPSGKKRHYFGISAHVTDRMPYSVEFGHLSSLNAPFRVELNSDPVYYSVASDIGILSATDIPPHIEKRLSELKPFVFLTSPLETVNRAQPNMEYFVTGRILPKALDNSSHKYPGYREGMWTETMRKQIDASTAEIAANQDERTNYLHLPQNKGVDPNSAGDLFFFTQTTALANGISVRMKDPDGLVPGEPSDPFLPSSTSWNPYSIAVPMVLNGRASGSTLISKVGDHVAVSGVMWTMGVAENVNQRILQINALYKQWLTVKNDGPDKQKILKQIEELSFGDIRAVADPADPTKLILVIPDGKNAPFAYASSAYRAAYELEIISRNGPRNKNESKILGDLQRGNRDQTDIDFIRQFLKRSNEVTAQMMKDKRD